jgi:membrane protein implicated in regulation of membrane protease activity
MRAAPMPNRSIPDILTDIIAQFTALLRTESRLARTEMSEKISQAAVAIGLIVAGAVLLMPALVILLQAAVAALVTSNTLPQPFASLLVGGIALLIGIVLALIGASRLKMRALAPERTINQLQRDVSVARQQARETYEQQRAA